MCLYVFFHFKQIGFRLVFLSFCIYNRTNTYITTKTNHPNSKKKHKQTHTKHNKKNINLPAGTWEIFNRGRVEGWISCIYVFICMFFFEFLFLLFCLCFFMFFFSVFLFYKHNMFSPSLFKLLHLQSNNKHIQKQNNT